MQASGDAVLAQVGDQPLRAEAADLLVVAEGEVDRERQVGGEIRRCLRQRDADERLHVGAAAAIQPAVAQLGAERIDRPVLAVPRHRVGVAGDDHPGRLAGADRREQVRLLRSSSKVSRLAMPWRASSSRTKWISARFESWLTVLIRTSERAISRARGRGGRHVHRCNIAAAPLRRLRWTSPLRHRQRPAAHRRRHPPHAGAAHRRRKLGIDGDELWLKLEQLQVGGSFKARGMFNRMRANSIPAAGVVIASGGNAGIAVACAAKALGVRCEVFVPETSGRAKRERLAHSVPPSTSSARATPRPSPPASPARARAGRCRCTRTTSARSSSARRRSPPRSSRTPALPTARSSASAAAGWSPGSAPGSTIAAGSRRSSPSSRRRCTAPVPPAGRSMSRWRGSPPIRSARAASARSPGR